MDTLRSIESFVKAVQAGSIAAGARLQGITAAAASQNIQRLEKSLGTRLLMRTTRKLALTESGALYYAEVQHLVDVLARAQSAITEFHGQPQGRLRIGSSVAFGRHVLMPLIPAFSSRFPQVSLELILSDRSLDHVAEDIDISIRFKQQLEPGLIARKIATVPVLFCAAPDYLQRKGLPQAPEDLSQHYCLLFRIPVDGRLLNWSFNRNGMLYEPEIIPSIVCNDIDSIFQLALAGAGIARLAAFVVNHAIKKGTLIPLFQPSAQQPEAMAAESVPLEFYACYRDKYAMTNKVRAFMDYLVSAIPQSWE
ncbi:LysR family transcriptional regulator [Methylophilus sp. YYY-1]|uniref:LysR family transcriptional regulator n=1 Tax=Methylophilus sp. YYY-1 TaxID=2682087 RepID=UPI0023B355F8|nr:LysR family transcriptional regulator [Methylophilus sp. YYY-1]MDF0377263.1 LysR family transcriptional regulator [Methylophilus sp. YYY-1]